MAAAPQFVLSQAVQWLSDTIDPLLESTVAAAVTDATTAILPIVTVALSLTMLLYGWAIMRGAIQMPVMDFVHRCFVIGVVVSIATMGGLYQTEIVKLIIALPSDLADVFTASGQSVESRLGESAAKGAEASTHLLNGATDGLSISRALAFSLVAVAVGLATVVLTAIGTALLVTTKVATALLACVGPLVIFGVLFSFTRGIFEKWVGQILQYALIMALFSLVFGILMGVYDQLLAAIINDAQNANARNIFGILVGVGLVAVASGLILWQVPAIASSLASGASLEVARAIERSVNTARSASGSHNKPIIPRARP